MQYVSFRISTNSPDFGFLIGLPLPVNGSSFFSGILSRKVFVWLLSIHKDLKVNILAKDFVCTYLFQWIEWQNRYLDIYIFKNSPLWSWNENINITISLKMSQRKSGKGSAHFQSSSGCWNDAMISGAERWMHFWRGEKSWSQFNGIWQFWCS